jgi:uncharacterized repeat protein (TIGR03806 family)
MRLLLLSAMALFAAAVGVAQPKLAVSDISIISASNPPNLSAFGFFDGKPDRPVSRLIPYQLSTPLFSDYAEKQRFIYLPAATKISSDPDGRLVFPVGTALIKSFGYPAADGELQVIETRLLLHRAEGWVALPYVWRRDGSDADLRIGGTRLPVSFKKPGGELMNISYAVPNKNQCKQCHLSGDTVMPIGPLWQNMRFMRDADRQRILKDNPMLAKLQREAKWDDAKSGTLEKRAHAYLRVNCGHCHAPKGSASNSGLFLDGSAKDLAAYGIGKRPVAAGRASGDLDFIIEPGKPNRSILVARMKSTDPGIAMPELGRAAAHDEGVKLLGEWIASMPPASTH